MTTLTVNHKISDKFGRNLNPDLWGFISSPEATMENRNMTTNDILEEDFDWFHDLAVTSTATNSY